MRRTRWLVIVPLIILIFTSCSRNTAQTSTVQVSEYVVSRTNLTDTITLSGTVQAREYADIKSLVSGIVKKVNVSKGDTVKAGDVIAELDDTEYRLAYIKALQNYETAKNSGSKLLIQQREIELELAKRDLENCKLLSPINGVVTSIDIKQGDLISTGKTIARVVNLEKLYVSASVDEVDYSRIALGQVATVSFDAIEGLTAGARVTYISSEAQTSQGIVVVPIELDLLSVDASQLGRSMSQTGIDQAQLQQKLQQLRTQGTLAQFLQRQTQSNSQNQSGRIIPGLSCEVNVVTMSKENVLAVPINAVKFNSGKAYVTVKKADGSTEEREISVGIRTNSFYEVVSGLEEGEVVLVTGRIPASSTTQRVPGVLFRP
ncbi:MAG: Efflux transporter, RND family, MFP subunit [Thermotoga sp. 50_1627]|uniref:efflux RND transporter periplasmic adaptor subunit n=1 Tax=Pseudothermotoga sp. TaxID=2033661 RepID=UPI00076CB273|nr:MAG: Efflux transporter, RND family, MFP subunit [Thermotoga sp. 50_64]KUK24647.1 MAG: Efflux transporter, RND family, MFP subunit [Thermotoga sp. 50_1627]MBC7117239.1 efflux RND transporter periplasmic adaptor subunit [Pseudothermotoga sp.]